MINFCDVMQYSGQRSGATQYILPLLLNSLILRGLKMRRSGCFTIAVLLLVFPFLSISHAASPLQWWDSKEKEQKLAWTLVGSTAFITAYGLVNWDYGERDASWNNEGWLGSDTKEGGADKFGHYWTAYTLGQSMSSLYRSWGYSKRRAASYGALSSFGIMTFMELGDAFSRFGFSPEDFTMNTLGSYAGYYLDTHPELARKLDFRIEYSFDYDGNGDLLTDYENLRYLAALKLSGFDSVKNKFLKHVEFHAGYYARGYSEFQNPDKARFAYVGIGFNLSYLLKQKSWNKTSKLLNYVQLPLTSAKHVIRLD